jgi:hypothetical protein
MNAATLRRLTREAFVDIQRLTTDRGPITAEAWAAARLTRSRERLLGRRGD